MCRYTMWYDTEASRGAGAQSMLVNTNVCGFHSHLRNSFPQVYIPHIYINLYIYFFTLVSRQSAALSFSTQHAMLAEFGGKWRTVCLNTRFSLVPC